ncbi:MAG: glycogen debranching enzyme [Actinobacteria bacterium]|nr:glycogen debranching enzyme [Actinomycetota bacterium]
MPPPDPGARWDGSATAVAVAAPGASDVVLCRIDGPGRETRVALEPDAHDPAWWVNPAAPLRPGDRYGFRVTGDGRSPRRLLLDPWARAVSGDVDWARAGPHGFAGDVDTAPFVPHGVVVAEPAGATGEHGGGTGTRPATPWDRTVVYEANVRSLTAAHPGVPPGQRGTFAALGHPAILEHLVKLGVTAVELLPVAAFVHPRFLWERGQRNLWGYDPIAPLAPHPGYVAGPDPVAEVRAAVRALHDAGLEVWLDVVFNHSGELGAAGPVLSWKDLDPAAYRRTPDGAFEDLTGCRNTFDARNPRVADLVVGALRHWAAWYGIDGFRFDLAATLARDAPGDPDPAASPLLARIAADPVLGAGGVKLIAEPWDLGPGGQLAGRFPPPWREWDGHFRDAARDAWRGARPVRAAIASCLAGGRDHLGAHRPATSGIAFVTCHDGFTLADLVAHDRKHNDSNGEEGRDGTDDNRSWNGGVEGPTTDPMVIDQRARRRRGLLATLLAARGVPMLLGGDEIGRTQLGNNNAWCQDGPVSWLDWAGADADLLAFARRAVQARRSAPPFAGDTWPEAEDLRWFGAGGQAIEWPVWHSSDDPVVSMVAPRWWTVLNPSAEDRDVVAPPPVGGAGEAVVSWRAVLDTAAADGDPAGPGAGPARVAPGDARPVPAWTVVTFLGDPSA